MDLKDVLLVAALGLLGLLTWAAYQLLREIRLLRWRLEAGREGKDGQTINVNLGAAGLHQPAPGPAPEGEALPPAPAEAGEEAAAAIADVEPEPPPLPRPRPAASVTVTPGGAIAVKCPKCGAENSAFRTECFMCETPLR